MERIMTNRPFEPGIIQPGMDRVIEAGDTLVIEDANGQEFAIKAVEGKATIAFIKAFDEWHNAKDVAEPSLLNALFMTVLMHYRGLPMEIQHQLPSMKSLGVGR